jgi:hypothetical protein
VIVESAQAAVSIFLGESPLDDSQAESAGYDPAAAARVPPSMHSVAAVIEGCGTDARLLSVAASRLPAAVHEFPAIPFGHVPSWFVSDLL